jgi:tetratricopeptide (TPR) repeat protein
MYDEAEVAFQQAIRLYPSSQSSIFRLVKMYEDNGELPKAIRTLSDYLAHSPVESTRNIKSSIKRLEALERSKSSK